jgi:hypothetical protein
MSKLRKINQGIDEVAASLEDVRDVPLSILRDLDMRVAEMLPELGKMVAKVEEGMKDPDKARLSRRTALAPALARGWSQAIYGESAGQSILSAHRRLNGLAETIQHRLGCQADEVEVVSFARPFLKAGTVSALRSRNVSFVSRRCAVRRPRLGQQTRPER